MPDDVNRNHFSPTVQDVTIVSEHHCHRTLGGVTTTNFLAARAAMADGCYLQQATFLLRHAEAMLCDLSNLEQPLAACDVDTILSTFDEIDRCTADGRLEAGVRRIQGDGLVTEIAISGPSVRALQDIKARLLGSILRRRQVGNLNVHRPSDARGIGRNKRLIEASEATRWFHNAFCKFYARFVHPGHWDHIGILNTRTIYDAHSVWSDIERLGENKLFILSAGLPIALGYLDATGDRKLFFVEVHRQNDAAALDRTGTFLDIFPRPATAGGSWVVIDKAYTGGSIRLATDILRRMQSDSAKITTVALFPKSYQAVNDADYVVYGGRLIRVADVIDRLDRATWHRQLLRIGRQDCP